MWDKVNNLFKKEFDSEPVYNDKYIKAKIDLYNANFYGNKTPRKNERYSCLSAILLDSIVNIDENKSTNLFKRMEICSKKENKYKQRRINSRRTR